MTIYVTQQDDRLDIICHNHYGRSEQAVEAVLDANPRLSRRGTILEAGIEIILPDLPDEPDRPTVKLWD